MVPAEHVNEALVVADRLATCLLNGRAAALPQHQFILVVEQANVAAVDKIDLVIRWVAQGSPGAGLLPQLFVKARERSRTNLRQHARLR